MKTDFLEMLNQLYSQLVEIMSCDGIISAISITLGLLPDT